MSLGWNTESALLPKKAKPISVGDKSLLALKALVYEKEQQQCQQLQNQKLCGPSSSYRSQRGHHQPNNKKSVFERSNKGIEARTAKEDPLKLAKSDKIYAALKAKSELYEQLQSSSSLSKAVSNAFLVDFSSKPPDQVASSSSSTVNQKNSSRRNDDNEDDDYSDIEDEFGRSKTVHRRSQEYISITLEREKKRRRMMYSGGGYGEGHNEDGHEHNEEERRGRDTDRSGALASAQIQPSQWAWSTGHMHKNDYYAGQEEEMQLHNADSSAKLLLQNRVESEISQAARVKSHWEKTISGKAKGYLEEIHSETMDLKRVAAEAHTSVLNSATPDPSIRREEDGKNNDNDASSVAPKMGGYKASAKEDRIAMIKRMREEKKGGSENKNL